MCARHDEHVLKRFDLAEPVHADGKAGGTSIRSLAPRAAGAQARRRAAVLVVMLAGSPLAMGQTAQGPAAPNGGAAPGALPSGQGAAAASVGVQVSVGAAAGENLVSWNSSDTAAGFLVRRELWNGTAWVATATMRVPPGNRSLLDRPPVIGRYRYVVEHSTPSGAAAGTPAPSSTAAANASGVSRVLTSNPVDFTSASPTVLPGKVGGSAATGIASSGRGGAIGPVAPATGGTSGTAWRELRASRTAVTNVEATQDATSGEHHVTWQGGQGATGFSVRRELWDGSRWVDAGTIQVGGDQRSLKDRPPTLGLYRYVVERTDSTLTLLATPSDTVAFMGPVPPTTMSGDPRTPAPAEPAMRPTPLPPNSYVPGLPAAPSELTVTATNNRSAMIGWTDNANNESGFEVERQPAFPSGTRALGANVQGTIDLNVTGSFSYRVRAVNAVGTSEWTSWQGTTVPEIAPAAPSGVTLTDLNNERDIRVRWLDNSLNETGFVIQHDFQDIDGTWHSRPTLSAPSDAQEMTIAGWQGRHRVRVVAVNQVGQSTPTDPVTLEVVGGWTVFTPASDTRIIYVSSTDGNDTNDGLSPARPKRTIWAGYELMREGFPDWLLLKRGDQFDNQMVYTFKSGRSASQRQLVATYGPSTQRPLVRSGLTDGGGRMGQGRTDNLAIVGIAFVPHLRTGQTPEEPTGFRWLDNGRNILLEDLQFQGYKDNISVQGFNGIVENFVIRRCQFLDAWARGGHSQGIYASKVNGLTFDQCLFDRNGWWPGVAEPTIFNHNIYVQVDCANVTMRETISARGSSHGAQIRPGGEVRNNLFIENAISLLIGTGGVAGGGTDPTLPVVANAQHNVILAGRNISSALPRGFGMDVMFTSSGTISHNLIKDIGSGTAPSAIRLDGNQGAGNRNLTISHNVIHNWGGPVSFVGGSSKLAGITFADNRIDSSNANVPLVSLSDAANTAAITARNNRYWAPNAPAPSLFRLGSNGQSFDQWRTALGETGSEQAAITAPNLGVSIANFNQAAGFTGGADELLSRMRLQSRMSWDARLTASSVNRYFRNGMGISEPTP